jgi:hypothetical protein
MGEMSWMDGWTDCKGNEVFDCGRDVWSCCTNDQTRLRGLGLEGM